MTITEVEADQSPEFKPIELSTAQKRRIRRKRLQAARNLKKEISILETSYLEILPTHTSSRLENRHICDAPDKTVHAIANTTCLLEKKRNTDAEMSSKEVSAKPRDDVIAAREAKKIAKQKAKAQNNKSETKVVKETIEKPTVAVPDKVVSVKETDPKNVKETVSKDEVDKVSVKVDTITGNVAKSKEAVLAERAAKKAAKQSKKKGAGEGDDVLNKDLTTEDIVATLKDIVDVAKDVQQVTAKVNAIHIEEGLKPEISTKTKAELRADRRAKQEAQRATKQAATQKVTKPTIEAAAAKLTTEPTLVKEDKVTKTKTLEKSKTKSQLGVQRVNLFHNQYLEQEIQPLKNVAINSNLHPAIIKLGVQLASRVVTGSSARCIALLDALKKMVTDYTLPAKTEFARGLEAHLSLSLDYLWAMRKPSAAQTNAVKYFRHHLTQLPNNVDVLDAKKNLHEEIDRYVREQIDMAGEAISIAVRNKISDGDNILTYGCSSLIERILVEAWESGLKFHTVVVGARLLPGEEMLRRLRTRGLPASYVDIIALSHVMHQMDKVIVGASALLVNGSVLGAAGTAAVCLAARAASVPVLVAARTHQVSHRVHAEPTLYTQLGDPDDLIDKSDEDSPLKDWRSNPLLTPINLLYDVTPPQLVTAVVTELAILPCTSAPVVLRFKSEYGI